MQARDLVRELSLKTHPEGGWYREFYRSATEVAGPMGPRRAVTAIHFLLERHQLSRWHVVGSDEIWSFSGGAPLEVFTYEAPSASLARRVLDRPPEHEPAIVVPSGVWQAARSLGDYSLVGCYVAPGFEFSDFRFVSALEDHERHFAGPLKDLSAFL